MTWLHPELDNLRAALAWFIAQGDADSAQRLAGASALYFYAFGYFAEGRRWLEEALALDAGSGPQDESAAWAGTTVGGAHGASSDSEIQANRRLLVRAQALVGIAQLTVNRGELTVAEEAASRSLQLDREASCAAETAWPLIYLSRVAQMRAEFGPARQFLEETLAVCRESGVWKRSVRAD
jgi:hypothetical protein